MDRTKFAVLDVEATIGDPTTGRIIEVAVIVHDGPQERMRWGSLVDPRTPLPLFAQRLTGIGATELRRAPTFSGILNSVDTLTQDRIIVAHNARFDMTMLEYEYARTGLTWHRTSLCTERCSRRLLPHLQQHNLGSLCRYFGIAHPAAHRAMPDAEATAMLFFRMMEEFGPDKVLVGLAPWLRATAA